MMFAVLTINKVPQRECVSVWLCVCVCVCVPCQVLWFVLNVGLAYLMAVLFCVIRVVTLASMHRLCPHLVPPSSASKFFIFHMFGMGNTQVCVHAYLCECECVCVRISFHGARSMKSSCYTSGHG